MRINGSENVTIFAGNGTQSGAAVSGKGAADGGRAAGSVYAGDSRFAGTRDLIAQKKEKARREAMKIVGDVFDGDRAIDDDTRQRQERIRTLKQERLANQKEINWINEEQARLQKTCGVAEDSEEQKELELLRKCRDPRGGASLEERKQAEAIRMRGLTEYQSRQLEWDDLKDDYQKKIDAGDAQIEQENRTLDAIRIERLKSDPMVKAQKQAGEILDSVTSEIVDLVVEDAKDRIDEESEERKEQAEKIREEREAREELIEARREKRREEEELLEDMPTQELARLDQVRTDVQQEVQSMLTKMKLLDEDIKGAAVDERIL